MAEMAGIPPISEAFLQEQLIKANRTVFNLSSLLSVFQSLNSDISGASSDLWLIRIERLTLQSRLLLLSLLSTCS